MELTWFWISISSFFLMSASFLLMPLEITLKYDVMTIMPGLLFWLFFVLGVIGQVVLGIRYNRWFMNQEINTRKSVRKKLGFLAFGQNKAAICVDAIVILSIVLLIAATYITHGTGYVCYILLAMCVFTFCLHCILNGKVYAYISKYYFMKGETSHVKR